MEAGARKKSSPQVEWNFLCCVGVVTGDVCMLAERAKLLSPSAGSSSPSRAARYITAYTLCAAADDSRALNSHEPAPVGEPLVPVADLFNHVTVDDAYSVGANLAPLMKLKP